MIKRGFCVGVMSFLVAITLILPRVSHAEDGREFIMSATYGVLAGTLVGAATLAFTDKPGDNLQNIARGASLGLYLGMLLGVYVVYWVPSLDGVPIDEYIEGEEEEVTLPQLMVAPTYANNRLDGASIHWQVYRF